MPARKDALYASSLNSIGFLGFLFRGIGAVIMGVTGYDREKEKAGEEQSQTAWMGILIAGMALPCAMELFAFAAMKCFPLKGEVLGLDPNTFESVLLRSDFASNS